MVVLNIDDDEDDGYIFLEALKEISPKITGMFISDPVEAVKFLQGEACVVPDYIFLDVNMPIMNGKQCLEELRKLRKLNNVPIIMFSTSISQNERSNYAALGADCLNKAADFTTLTLALKRILLGQPTVRTERKSSGPLVDNK